MIHLFVKRLAGQWRPVAFFYQHCYPELRREISGRATC